MRYNKLGTTDLKVSHICLGTMTYGEQTDIQDAHKQLSMAIENGINFIDTAELYPVPVKQATGGDTETIIGKWLKQQKQRDKLIIASKISGSMGVFDGGKSENAFSKAKLKQACDRSLKRLQTEYIDLYQLHWPSRKTNFFDTLTYKHNASDEVSFTESLEALQELMQAGKIRHFGVSNETPWGLLNYLREHEQKHLPRVQSIQNPYSLLNRLFEIGLNEISTREKISMLVYSPLGMGTLTGKYNDGNFPPNSRMALFGDSFGGYVRPACLEQSRAYAQIAQKHGLSQLALALAFVNSQPFVTSNIIGATTTTQLQEILDASDLLIDDNILTEIDSAHKQRLLARFSEI